MYDKFPYIPVSEVNEDCCVGWAAIAATLRNHLSGSARIVCVECYPGVLLDRLCADLGKEFSDVQFFGTHRVVDYHAWARVLNGKLVRHYAFVGDRAETVCDFGKLTDDERKLGLVFDGKKFPAEQDVMNLAAAWSIDPSTLDQLKLDKSVGQLGSR